MEGVGGGVGWVGGEWVEQEWSKVGALMTALAPQKRGPRSNPGVDAIRGLSLLLVLFLAPRGSSPDTPFFFSPQKYVLMCTLVTSKDRMWLKLPGIFSPKRQNLKEFRRNPLTGNSGNSGKKIE